LKLTTTIFRVGAAVVLATVLCIGALAASSSASSTPAPVRVTPKFTAHSLPPDSNPGGVVKGPDGNLWATEEFGGVIDRVTPAGQLTVYHLPGIKGYPNYITVGADRALWFTVEPNNVDGTGQGIGRITTSGHFKFWPIPTIRGSLDIPEDIVAGPSDTLWFTFDAPKGEDGIGRVSLSDPSKVTAYSLGAKAGPLMIVPGPEQTFWFTEESANRIGRITTSGTIKTYHAAGAPFGLTASPSGGFWFTEYRGNRVGQITRDGRVTECPTFGKANTFPTFIVHKSGYFWLFRSGDSEITKQPVKARSAADAHLTAVDGQCGEKSWALPDRGDPWFLGDGPGETLAFTQFQPAAVGKITLEPGPTLTRTRATR
jgi:virginiamycin B lyase